MGDEDLEQKLMEEHKGDFEPTETSIDSQGSDSGGSDGGDNTEDAPTGDDDSNKDESAEPGSEESPEAGTEPEEDEAGPAESDDRDESGAEQVGEKKDANSRIRQLNEEKKAIQAEKEALAEEKRAIEEKLAAKEKREREVADLAEDPVYELEDFIGTLDENGDMLSDGEANARFRAWEADYKLRQYEKKEVLRDQQKALIDLQSQTQEAFTKFPEFDAKSTEYDAELAAIANEAFRAGIIYAPGHDNDDNFIIGSRIHPGQLLEKLHKLRAKEAPVTKVNNLGDDNGSVVSSQQVNKKTNQYAPGFRGEVDKAIDEELKKARK